MRASVDVAAQQTERCSISSGEQSSSCCRFDDDAARSARYSGSCSGSSLLRLLVSKEFSNETFASRAGCCCLRLREFRMRLGRCENYEYTCIEWGDNSLCTVLMRFTDNYSRLYTKLEVETRSKCVYVLISLHVCLCFCVRMKKQNNRHEANRAAMFNYYNGVSTLFYA